MNTKKEQYKPSAEEIQAAEDMMTEGQRERSKAREIFVNKYLKADRQLAEKHKIKQRIQEYLKAMSEAGNLQLAEFPAEIIKQAAEFADKAKRIAEWQERRRGWDNSLRDDPDEMNLIGLWLDLMKGKLSLEDFAVSANPLSKLKVNNFLFESFNDLYKVITDLSYKDKDPQKFMHALSFKEPQQKAFLQLLVLLEVPEGVRDYFYQQAKEAVVLSKESDRLFHERHKRPTT